MVIKKFALFKTLAFTFLFASGLISPENTARADDAVPAIISKSPLQAPSVVPIEWKSATVKRDILSLDGVFRRNGVIRNWVVLWEDQEWKISDDRRIKIQIPYDPQMKTLELTLTGSLGQVEYHFYNVKTQTLLAQEEREKKEEQERKEKEKRAREQRENDEREKQAKETQGKQKNVDDEGESFAELIRRIRLEPGLSIGRTTYEQTDVERYESTTLNLSALATLQLTDRWDAHVGMDFTLINVFRSHEPQNRIFNYNMQGGYHITEIEAPWSLVVRGGWFYHTLFTTSNDYGYANISGPMLQPTVKRRITSENEASFSLKYGLITDRLKLLGADNSMFGFSLGYSLPFQGRETTIKLDYYRVRVENPGITIMTRFWTLGAMIAF